VSEPVIREYRETDRARVYEICTRTGLRGSDATGQFSTDDLIPDVFAGPYVEFEPELALVVDVDGEASGYIIATADTRVFVARYRGEWLPYFAAKYPVHVDPPTTREEEFVHLGYTPERMLIPEVDDFPAHLHIDLLPEVQGKGLGRRLIDTLSIALVSRNVVGLHLTVDPANSGARVFYDRLGFRELGSGSLGIATLKPARG
jgi:GNAT superfamily N-acetyltransferase